MKNGIGILYYFNGDSYLGNFMNDYYNDYGIFTWNNGNKYAGNWI